MVCSIAGRPPVADLLLQVAGLCKHFGGIMATDHVSLAVERGTVHALIGPNGAGKTTLVAQLSGMLAADAGVIHFDGRDVTRARAPARARQGLIRTFQTTSVFHDMSVLDNVALAIQAQAGHSYRFWKPARADPALREPAQRLLHELGLGGCADMLASELAHGEQRQLEIAVALATKPKMLLLDEPMAGMGHEDSARMTAFLRSLKSRCTMLLVEHDMDAVFALADRLSVLVNGRMIASGTPDTIRANPDVRQAYLGEEQAGA